MTDGVEYEAGATIKEVIEEMVSTGIVHISCRKIQVFDDKLVLDLDENTLLKMKTIVINMGKNTYTFKQS